MMAKDTTKPLSVSVAESPKVQCMVVTVSLDFTP